MSVLLKAMYRFYAIFTKYYNIFHRTRTNNTKSCMEPQKTPNSQRDLEKGKKARGITIPDFKTYYKAIIMNGSMAVAQK